MWESQRDPIEDALAALQPAPSSVDRDRVLFEAGRRAGRRTLWPVATGTAALAAATLAVALWLQATPRVVRDVRYVHVPTTAVAVASGTSADRMPAGAPIPPPATYRLDGTSYGRLRQLVLADGVDAMPRRPAARVEPVRLEELLGGPSSPSGVGKETGGRT
jgi:hypothetical protein